MTPATIQRLNQLNQQFYQTVGPSFSTSREKPWAGWLKLIEEIKQNSDFNQSKYLRVWDVGCGNGRFGEFLAKELPDWRIEYWGSETSPHFLSVAAEKLERYDNLHTTFIELDVTKSFQALNKSLPFDVIVLFGVLHHIPSFRLREKLFIDLASHLNLNGKLIVTAWQFDQIPSLMKRAITPAAAGFDSTELEPNDYFLTWERGESAIRYCHLIDQSELQKITKSVSKELTLENTFFDDGKNQKTNLYSVWRKATL